MTRPPSRSTSRSCPACGASLKELGDPCPSCGALTIQPQQREPATHSRDTGRGNRATYLATGVAVLIGGVSSAVGYWVAPVVSCGDVTVSEAAHYCGLEWWFTTSNVVVILGGAVVGALFGLWSRLWTAAVAGIFTGNLVGPLVGLWIARQTPEIDAIFGNPPSMGGAWLPLGLMFTVVGGIAWTIGWTVAVAVRSLATLLLDEISIGRASGRPGC